MDNKQTAINLEQEGDKLLEKKFYFFGNKYEDAIIKYKKAANIYKYNKLWSNAAQIYIKISKCCEQLDDTYEKNLVIN